MLKRLALIALFLGSSVPCIASGAAPASSPAADAWPLYKQAIARIEEGHRSNIMSPAESGLVYNDYPPFPPQWHQMEKASYEFNAPAFALAHQARSRNVAHWPPLHGPDGQIAMGYLHGSRELANELADAALQQHINGDDAAAVESLRDLLHLADLLDSPDPTSIVQTLVAVGVRMIAMNRLEVITAGIALSDDPKEAKKLRVDSAKDLIRRLFDVQDPAPRYAGLLGREMAAGQWTTAERDRFILQLHRAQMERNLAAMSLACHLFRFDKHRWPATIADVIVRLPAPPRDHWGLMGYALVQSDLPGQPQRPLVYSHCDSQDGLFHPTDEPQYSWYPGFGTGSHRKHGGQFRDVSLWAPARPNPAPATRPLGQR